MIKSWSDEAWDDYLYRQREDKKTLKRINLLVKDIDRKPYTGIGKQEPLKYNLTNCWSRRITGEHRLVYQISDNGMEILQCRYHY